MCKLKVAHCQMHCRWRSSRPSYCHRNGYAKCQRVPSIILAQWLCIRGGCTAAQLSSNDLYASHKLQCHEDIIVERLLHGNLVSGKLKSATFLPEMLYKYSEIAFFHFPLESIYQPDFWIREPEQRASASSCTVTFWYPLSGPRFSLVI